MCGQWGVLQRHIRLLYLQCIKVLGVKFPVLALIQKMRLEIGMKEGFLESAVVVGSQKRITLELEMMQCLF